MNYYFAHDKTPSYRFTSVNTAGTTTLWTVPSTSKLTITGLTVTNNAAAQQLTFSLGSSSTAPASWYVMQIGASATINPVFGPIDGSAAAYNLYVNGSGTGATNGQAILVTGFMDPTQDVSRTVT